MGFRFRKSINLGGGVRLNVGKNGVGVSAGVKGLRVSHGADGKTRVTASIPGTGISYQETIGGTKPKQKKQKENLSGKKQIQKNELLYTFQGTLRVIREDGKMVYDEFNRHFYNGVFTVSFYLDSVHMIDPDRGQSTQNAFITDVSVRKNISETGFWIFKGSRSDVMIEVNGTEYTFQVADEFAADGVVQWHTDFVENWNALLSIDGEMDEEDLLASDWVDAAEDGDYGFIGEEEPLIMSCTHCFTRDEVEEWQLSIDEGTNQTIIYCRHCGLEYDSQESLNWESQFLNEEGNYAFNSMVCGECYEDISLIGVPYEDGIAHVTCPNCQSEILVTPPS